jgi:predicted nuclease with RNAse H fold
VTDDDIIAPLRAYHPAVVAIDAPLTLPAPGASALCGKDAMGANSRPYTRAAERDHTWTALGIRPLPVSFLGGLTFRAICLVARLRDALPESAISEAFPSGARASRGLRADVPGVHRQGKTTEAARRGLQLELAALIDGIPEPTPGPLSADLLDALLGALTAVAYTRDRYLAIGAAGEGQIILPLSVRSRCDIGAESGLGGSLIVMNPRRDCNTPLIRLYTLVSHAGHSMFVGTSMPREPLQPGGRMEAENARTRSFP